MKNSNSNSIPIFVYDGTNARIISNKNEKLYDVIGNVKTKIFKETYQVSVCMHKCKNLKLTYTKIKDVYPSVPISYLKSHLQKCVRRQQTELALCTVNSLFAKNAEMDLLRRLIVIGGEDVMVGSYMFELVWFLMAVSKGFKLSNEMRTMILHIVTMLCEFPFQDKAYMITNVTQSNVEESLSNQLSFILQIGRGYLGMKGDLLMFHKLSYIWYKRMKDKNVFEFGLYNECMDLMNYKFDSINLHSYFQLNPQDMLLCAIDYHICDIDKRIQSVFDIDIDLIRSAIWVCSSNVNNRINTDIDLDNNPDNEINKNANNTWDKISALFEIEAKNKLAFIRYQNTHVSK